MSVPIQEVAGEDDGTVEVCATLILSGGSGTTGRNFMVTLATAGGTGIS